MTRMIVISLALVALLFAPIVDAQTSDALTANAELRVLLVGHDPKAPDFMFSDASVKRTNALYRERTAAFEALLRFHFVEVEVVFGQDYREEMSKKFDVTIFDVRPKKLTDATQDHDENGNAVAGTYRPATYLSEKFDGAAIMISGVTPMIGEPLGLKLDWL